MFNKLKIIVPIFLIMTFAFLFIYKHEMQSNVSLTYRLPYEEIEKQILYAKLSHEGTANTRTYKTIRDKERLIKIIKAFDRLKAENEQLIILDKYDIYVLVVWREGKSVSFVFMKTPDGYYEGSPIMQRNGKIVCHKMSDELVDLIFET